MPRKCSMSGPSKFHVVKDIHILPSPANATLWVSSQSSNTKRRAPEPIKWLYCRYKSWKRREKEKNNLGGWVGVSYTYNANSQDDRFNFTVRVFGDVCLFADVTSCQKMSFRYVCFQEHVTVRRNIIPPQKKSTYLVTCAILTGILNIFICGWQKGSITA